MRLVLFLLPQNRVGCLAFVLLLILSLGAMGWSVVSDFGYFPIIFLAFYVSRGCFCQSVLSQTHSFITL